MITFYLIRHGDKLKTPDDPGLSQLGIKQAKSTARYFVGKKITHLLSSSLKRAVETAKYIEDNIHIPIQIDPRLRERLNWGDDPQLNFEEFIKEWNLTTIDRSYEPKVGDSSRNAGNRMLEAIEEKAKLSGTNIVLVSHGGVIVDLLRNLFTDDYLKSLLPNIVDAGIPECSITTLQVTNTEYKITEISSTKHLLK